MNLYRNADGTWVGTKAEAEKGASKIEVPINPKSAVIAFLNGLNAERREVVVSEANTETTPMDEPMSSFPPVNMSLDEQVSTAPLRRRLGWAVEAIDSAESMIGKMSEALRARS